MSESASDDDFDRSPLFGPGEPDSEPEDAEEEEEDGGAGVAPERTGFSKISAGILGRELKSKSAAPILAMKQSVIKQISQREKERKEQSIASKAKRELSEQNSVRPYDASSLNFEKTLIKVATKGVVKLFTAVAQQNMNATKSLGHSRVRARGIDELSDQDEPEPEAEAKVSVSELVKQKRDRISQLDQGSKKQKGAAWMSDTFATKEAKAWDEKSDSD
eukprot:TRINITY_DN61249_c0_g1_i1.p1 TRINITY_DN61249_c0_g1~~TRINITY_DN61249_c0_g1_i1.p1  ORF type:complete len:219 (+),score=55.71 TRINITY_DN61249_c0_g1_i1:234-890(+)